MTDNLMRLLPEHRAIVARIRPGKGRKGIARPRQNIFDRLWKRSITIPHSGCYVWLGVITNSGYGAIKLGYAADGTKRLGLVHRVAYEELVGPIPEGLDLDHKCSVRSCWRPDHLEPVTRQENVRRAAAKTQLCPQGHPYSHLRRTDGARMCRVCMRATAARYRARQEKTNAA